MADFSSHPSKPLLEIEVFLGFIHNRHGAQTRRQHETSIKLRDFTDRLLAHVSAYIRQYRTAGSKPSDDDDGLDDHIIGYPVSGVKSEWGPYANVGLALACLQVANKERPKGAARRFRYTVGGRERELVSFRVVAAGILRREIEKEFPISSKSRGGFVGVR